MAAPESVSVGELNQQTTRYVQKVARTHRPLLVTNRNRSTGVALVPVQDGPAALERLVADGHAAAPTVHGPWAMPPVRDNADSNVADALSADRDEERW